MDDVLDDDISQKNRARNFPVSGEGTMRLHPQLNHLKRDAEPMRDYGLSSARYFENRAGTCTFCVLA